MREIISQKPFQAPFRSMASKAYSEQLGAWRHSMPIHGRSVAR